MRALGAYTWNTCRLEWFGNFQLAAGADAASLGAQRRPKATVAGARGPVPATREAGTGTHRLPWS